MSHVLTAVAWPYANGPRHIGHVAGFGVPSDVFSRYMRMAGHDVLMVSGSDEHGTPILVQADKAGMTPQEFIDVNHRLIVEDLVRLGVSYDLYTRTTTANQYSVVQEMFLACYRNGYMIEQTQQVAISPSTGRTLPDRYIEGTCPICGYGEARGDQCDNCGNQLDPADLIDPRSKVNGETPEFKDTQHFFLDLPALADALAAWLAEREASGLWRPNVIAFSKNILKEIRPRAMTRDIDWGIPVPLDGWRDQSHKRLYVWFDAVIGYLAASVEWARRLPGDQDERWREWWNDPEALSYYFMGKDNITFHSQIWPAEMLAHNGRGAKGGEQGPFGELNLPTEVVSSEFLTMEGKQFSTSRAVVIYVRDVLDRYQPDALRYFLSAAAPETADSDFSWSEFLKRTNTELVAAWGNLVNRTASMIAKNFGEIPQAGELEDVDRALLDQVRAGFDTVGGLIATHKQKAGLAEAMRLVGEANAYVSTTEPFKLKGEDQRERLGTVLHVLAQAVVDLNTILSPYLPHSSTAVHQALGGEGVFQPMPQIAEVSDLDDAGRPDYPVITGEYSAVPRWEHRPVTVGAPVAKPSPIFTKLDPSVVDEERARLGLVDAS
ncbi:methionine--tRNA ligase [Ornithinimicrobium tianjinense]|uniref:Methionine--tRNA ligase n=1 Tax=Ornithinimicrobium tianjinense TaxID=1195761 RepID=A0A917BDG9_9MICO|nr:methionine--tRNA ligase [Ornithinimicrobium tianjinense]GGF38744.1 methionine--tRNA ligase [Ornithinimicrobium tianjinense]